MVCFLPTDTFFLPSPMVARNVLGSNSRFFLPTIAELINSKFTPVGSWVGTIRDLSRRSEFILGLGWFGQSWLPPSYFSAPANRRSRCGSVRGWPVPSSHFSFGLAPQVGQ